jgi:hypothetical protein
VFHEVTTMTARDTVRTLRLALWDEDRQRLVSFADAAGRIAERRP